MLIDLKKTNQLKSSYASDNRIFHFSLSFQKKSYEEMRMTVILMKSEYTVQYFHCLLICVELLIFPLSTVDAFKALC